MISGQNRVLIRWFGGLMDLMNTFKRFNELRIRFQLSSRAPTKVAAFWLTVRCTVFEVPFEVEDVFDEQLKKNCTTWSDVCVILWRALNSLISVRSLGFMCQVLKMSEKKGGTTLTTTSSASQAAIVRFLDLARLNELCLRSSFD
jgi:hypothetical protein